MVFHTYYRFYYLGQRIMGFVYFSLPVIAGIFIMQYALSKSEENIGINGSKLPRNSAFKSETKMQNNALSEILTNIKNQNTKS
jgi:hypothetical protein